MATQKFNVRYILYVPEWDSGGADSGFPAAVDVSSTQGTTQSLYQREGGFTTRTRTTQFAILPWVTDVRWRRTPPTTVTMTDGGYVTERTDRFMPGDVVISGDIDKLPYRLVQKLQMVNSDTVPADSADPEYSFPPAFRLLSAAIALVRDVIRAQSVTLHLYSVDEGKYYVVEPLSEAQVRGGRNRVGLHYEFAFRVLDSVEPPRINAAKAAMPSIHQKNWRSVVTDEIDKVNNGMAAVVDGMKETFGDIERFGLRLATLADATQSLTALADLTRVVTHSPKRVATAFTSAEGKALQAFAEMRMACGGMARESSAYSAGPGAGVPMVPTSMGQASSLRAIESMLAATERAYFAAASAARLGGVENQSVTRPYRIQRSDSLASIALATLGDPGRANELATLNGLRAPYVSNSRIPGTVGPGDTIILPATEVGVNGTLATLEVPSDERLYGRGVKLTDDGDWDIAGDGLGVDTVAGIPCVEQGLRVRFDTVRGTNPVFTGIGLPEVVGEELTETRRYTLGVDGLWQLRRDDRVESVKDFSLADGGNSIGINATVLLTNRESITVAT